MNCFSELPCGQTIPPNNIHAVSVSIPRLSEVIGYEEDDPTIREKIKSGYPRFVTHPLLIKIQQLLHEKYGIDKNKEVILISSQLAVEELFSFVGKQFHIIEDQSIFGVCLNKNSTDIKDMQLFLQHTGYIPSSRLAEQYLFENGALSNRFEENLYSDENPQEFIKDTLADAYGLQRSDGISFGSCGMNAIFAAFRTLQEIQQGCGRDLFIQFGWSYLDTMEILKKFSAKHIFFESITAMDRFEELLRARGDQIAAVFTEVTTNPLIQTPDLPALYNLARQYDVPVVVDATFGTPYNVDVMPYADIVTESLTKFACGNADVMMGAFIVNEASPWYSEIMKRIPAFLETPFAGDLRRLAFEIRGYGTRMTKINENTFVLMDYFAKCRAVREIYWPYQELTRDNYRRLQKHTNAAGGIISLVFNEPLERMYDRIRLPKGPSVGTEFTLLMPYVYLAHYDLITSKEGRKQLAAAGIHPDLLRVSVGMEDVETIIGMFEEALK